MSKENKTAIKITLAYLSFRRWFYYWPRVITIFVNHGNYIYTAIITGIIVTFGTRQTSKVGYRLDANQYDISLHSLFGKVLGTIIDYLIVFFLFGLTVVMIAGGGSALQQGFNVPTWIGSFIIVLLLFFILLLNFNKIIGVLGIVTPFLVIAVFIIAGFNIIQPTVPFNEVAQHIQPSKQILLMPGGGTLFYMVVLL